MSFSYIVLFKKKITFLIYLLLSLIVIGKIRNGSSQKKIYREVFKISQYNILIARYQEIFFLNHKNQLSIFIIDPCNIMVVNNHFIPQIAWEPALFSPTIYFSQNIISHSLLWKSLLVISPLDRIRLPLILKMNAQYHRINSTIYFMGQKYLFLNNFLNCFTTFNPRFHWYSI